MAAIGRVQFAQVQRGTGIEHDPDRLTAAEYRRTHGRGPVELDAQIAIEFRHVGAHRAAGRNRVDRGSLNHPFRGLEGRWLQIGGAAARRRFGDFGCFRRARVW